MSLFDNISASVNKTYQQRDSIFDEVDLLEQTYGGTSAVTLLNSFQQGFGALVSPTTREDFGINGTAGRAQELIARKDNEITDGTSRGSYDIPANLGETTTFSTTTYSYYTGLHVQPSAFQNNVEEEMGYMNERFKQVNLAHAKEFNTNLFAYLEANKTTSLNTDNVPLTFDAGTDVLQVPNAQRSERYHDYINEVLSNSGLRDLSNYIEIRSREKRADGIEFMKFGSANSENLQGQAQPMASFVCESSVLDKTGVGWTSWLIRKDHLAMMDALPFQYRNGQEVIDGKKFSSIDIPRSGELTGNILPYRLSLLEQMKFVSNNTTSNFDRDTDYVYQMSMGGIYTFVSPYKETKDNYGIIKVQGLNS